MTQVVRLRCAKAHELAPGVRMRPLFGDGAMLNLLEFEPGARVDSHQHRNEQLGYVLEGSLVLAIDGSENVLKEGDAFQIGENVAHAAWSIDGCVVLDVFQPIREDYRRRVLSETE